MAGMPLYSDIGHDIVLDIRGQIEYPIPEAIYCFNYILNESQDAAYTKLMTMENVTGLWSFLGTQLAIYETNFANDTTKVNYLIIAVVITVILIIIWFALTLWYELRVVAVREVKIKPDIADLTVNIINTNSVINAPSRNSEEIPEAKANNETVENISGNNDEYLIMSRKQSEIKRKSQLADEIQRSELVDEKTDDFGRIQRPRMK
ncbi:Hypothetical_protein [Hexamita inflata]|uniref:Hypothetical_protein n=1 Tax=Hexamita inflata TaxID=28002 RepID=A0ABP1HLT4_9EUKA